MPDYRVSGENEAAYKLRFLFASPSFAMEKLSSLRKDTEMPQTFDVFLPESGTYDKRLRDVESIGSLQDYLTLHGEDYLSETADTLTSSAVPGMSPRSAKCAAKRGRS